MVRDFTVNRGAIRDFLVKTPNKLKLPSQLAVASIVSLLVVSCGGNGASNNDQGMSVTLLGLFNSTTLTTTTQGSNSASTGQQGCGRLPGGLVGGYVKLGEVSAENSTTLSADNASGTDPSGAFVSVVGIQNNLYGQAFRAERLLLDYYVPGATAQPPSTNVPVSLLTGPAEAANNTTVTTTTNPGLRKPQFTALPPTLANICNRGLAQATIIPASIREWLNFNRDLLPEAPYKLEVTMRVSGVSTAGDRIETNDVTLDFDVLPETYVNPEIVPGEATAEATPTTVAAQASGLEAFESIY